MTAYSTFGQGDEAIARQGDTGFVGVDMRTPAQLLPPGFVSYAENSRFRYGVAEPRKGLQALTWTSLTGIEFPIEFPILWNSPISIGTPVGVGLWADPNGDEWQLVAAKSTAFDLGGGNTQVFIWAIKPGNLIRQVPTAATLSSAEGELWFEDSFNVVTLHRGFDADPLVMTNIDVGFQPIELSEGGVGTVPIPRSKTALHFGNRLVVPHRPTGAAKADAAAVSDILDYTRYLEQINDFRINQGDSDEIVRAVEFNEYAVVFFKDTSIYAVTNLVGDWQQNARLETITTEYGLIGPRSVAKAGKDLVFLSPRGVVTIQQTEFNKTQGITTPLSEKIQPLIDRINWRAAKVSASAAYYQDRYYLAVPIDGSDTNNAVFVYDFLNQAWSGLDTGVAAEVKYFQIADFGGVEHLYAFNHNGIIGLYEYAEEDDQQVTPSSFTAEIFLVGQPADGSTLTINEGDIIRATQKILLRDASGNFLVDANGNYLYAPAEENIFVPDAATPSEENLWGVGDYGADPCSVAASNLFLGLTVIPENDSEPWDDPAIDTVEAIDCGVRLTSTRPILVEVTDPNIKVVATPSLSFEPQPIQMVLITRGYGWDVGERKRFTRTNFYVGTWDAQYEVVALTDGVNEEEMLVAAADSVTNRVKYTIVDTSDWDESNDNDDHQEPEREDYSVELPETGMQLGAAGVVLDLYQPQQHKLLVSQHGSHYRVKFTLSQGRVRLYAVTTGDIPSERRFGRHE